MGSETGLAVGLAMRLAVEVALRSEVDCSGSEEASLVAGAAPCVRRRSHVHA
jgi:hypothetical protein